MDTMGKSRKERLGHGGEWIGAEETIGVRPYVIHSNGVEAQEIAGLGVRGYSPNTSTTMGL